MKAKILFPGYLVLILLITSSCENEPIEIPVTGIELASSSNFIVEVGLNDTLELILHPENATDTDISWSSSDSSIAKVSSDGVVSGIAPGMAIITVTSLSNGFSVTDTVHVIRWTHFDMEDVHSRPIAIDAGDNVWCGGVQLTLISDDVPWVYPTDARHISALAVAGREIEWLGTHGSGIWIFDGTYWSRYTENGSNPAYSITSMMFDAEDNLWFGTANSDGYGTGVTIFDGNQWHMVDSEDGLLNNVVSDMAFDKQGKKWFTTNEGISSYDGANWITFTSENTGIDFIDKIFSVAVDKENNKWFGSYRGILKFDDTKWTLYDTSNSDLKWETINDIAVDKDDNIWFATESGVSKFDGTNWTNYTSAREFTVINVRTIAIDSKGNKWLGTSSGVIKFEDGN